MKLHPAPLNDLSELKQALGTAGLPHADLVANAAEAPGCLFWRFSDAAGESVGYAGLERHGDDGLIRSIVVLPGRRHQGYGREIVRLVIAEAARMRLRDIWLLTMDATNFFTVLGFQQVERQSAPPAILATPEFSSLCPAGAACMRLSITSVGA